MPLRLAIVNDYEVVVRGLTEMLSADDDIRIVEVDARREPAQPVDIALCDTFAGAQGDGPEITRLLRNPLVRRVVVYTWNDDPQLIHSAVAHGVSGYLSKTLTGPALVAALRAVHAGRRIVSPRFDTTSPDDRRDWPGRRHGLTEREAEMIALITQGLSNAEIAERTSISINSVKTYIRLGYQKLGVASRTQAVLWGVRHGFLPDEKRITEPAD